MNREIERLPDDSLYENSAEKLQFFLYSKDTREPLDIGNGIVKWYLTKYNQKGYSTDLVKTAEVTVDALGRTQAMVELTSEDTQGKIGSYLQQLNIEDESGNHVITQGYITFFVNIAV